MSKSNLPSEQNSSEIIELDFDFSESTVVSDVFFKESEEILSDLDEQILRVELFPHDELLIQSLFRKIHTLKGSAGAVPGGQLFSSLAHEFEALLETLRKEKVPPNRSCCELFLHSSRLLKVLAENLRSHREIYPEELSEVIELITRYGSFQIEKNTEAPVERPVHFENVDLREKQNDGIWISKEQMAALVQISSEFITLKNTSGMPEDPTSQKLSHLSTQLQGCLDKAQKIPLQEVFSGIFPLARQAAYELQKEVELSANGLELEVDKFLAQDLNKALMHMIRNALDHGIESANERLSAGKSPTGNLQISVTEKSSYLFCEIIDDGRGMDSKKILDRALEKGLVNALQASQMSKEEILNFVFQSGFSTKSRVTTLSGRGVGMDVVLNLVKKHNGTIRLNSDVGLGCKIEIKIPVPKALLVEQCLVASMEDLVLAFPLDEVSTIATVKELHVTYIQNQRFCQFEGNTVLLTSLAEIYEKRSQENPEALARMSAVFMKSEGKVVGILVDSVQHQADLVIKPFNALTQKTPGFKGISIMAGDAIAYVLDPTELLSLVKGVL